MANNSKRYITNDKRIYLVLPIMAGMPAAGWEVCWRYLGKIQLHKSPDSFSLFFKTKEEAQAALDLHAIDREWKEYVVKEDKA